MLTALRADIQKQTGPYKVTQVASVSRTLYVIASPSIAHIKDWYSQWFPAPHPSATDMYPWIVAGDDEAEFRTAAARAVAGAFDATLAVRLRNEPDFKLLESVSQVLIVADLSDSEAIGRVEMARRVLGEEIGQVVTGAQTSVAWTGVFTLRRPGVPGSPAAQGVAAATADAISRLDRLMRDPGLTRVLLVDVVNSAGSFLSREKDAHIVAAELLYFLTSYPARLGVAGDFHDQWLNRCRASEGRVAGAAAVSLVLPIDQILETVTLYRGADVVERAFLSDEGLEHSGFYVKSFFERAGLLSPEETAKTFSTRDDVKLDEPLAQLDGLEPTKLEEFTAAITELDASLPKAAEENGKKVRQIAEKRLADWKILLEDHVESILVQETGGLPLTRKFLAELRVELLKLCPSSGAATPAPDRLDELLTGLKRTIDTGPRTTTMLARALALSLVVCVGTYFLPLGFIIKAAVMVGVPVVSLGVAALMILNFRDRVSKQGEEVRKSLRKKWADLMKGELDKTMKEFLGLLVGQVELLEKEADAAEKRVQELVDFLRKRYVPPFPEEHAAWIYVARTREQLLKFAGLCNPDIIRVADTYLSADRPLYPWRRLSPARPDNDTAEPDEPNAWEWNLLEKAALRIVPSCSEILLQHVLSYLQGDPAAVERFQDVMAAATQPYVVLRPDRRTQEDRLAVVEIESEDVQPVAHELTRHLEKYFSTVRTLGQLSRYRVSVFGFLENALLTDVILGPGKGRV